MGMNTRQVAALYRAEPCAAIVATIAADATLLAVTAAGNTIMRMDAGQGAVCNRAGGVDRPLLYRRSAMVPMRRGGYRDGREHKDTRKTRQKTFFQAHKKTPS